jgi:succinylarginine dihydrolase
VIDALIDQGVFDAVEFVDVGQSMNNGGGPACLRLRVVLTPAERSAIDADVFFNESLRTRLTGWIQRHYRDHLDQDDLADPQLLTESYTALDELTGLLGLGAVFPFQR